MNILYFHQYFSTPNHGGSIRSYEFAQSLIKKGHKVTMVCGGFDGKFDLSPISRNISRGDVDGVDVVQIRVHSLNKDGLFKRGLDFVKFGFLGIKIALKEDYDLLFATSTPLTAGIPGIFAKCFKRKSFKFVFEVRDLWPELPKALGVKNPLVLGGMSVLEKMSYTKSDACVGLSPGICEGIKRRSPKNHPIKLIPNGSDLNLFVRNSKVSYKIDGVSESDTVAVFTGSHGIANGLDAVLDMAKVLQQRNINNIKIVFVGEGKVKSHLIDRKKAENIENCIFLDSVNKFELNEIMSRADMGLMVLKNVPAFYYGTSPNKFFDYISASLPIVNNYPGWLADLIKDNNCGIAVQPDDPFAFADAVQKMAASEKMREEMGKNGRLLAEREFARDMLSERLADYLEDVVKEKGLY